MIYLLRSYHIQFPDHLALAILSARDTTVSKSTMALYAANSAVHAVVADVGGYATKIGYAGEDHPRSYFRSVSFHCIACAWLRRGTSCKTFPPFWPPQLTCLLLARMLPSCERKEATNDDVGQSPRFTMIFRVDQWRRKMTESGKCKVRLIP